MAMKKQVSSADDAGETTTLLPKQLSRKTQPEARHHQSPSTVRQVVIMVSCFYLQFTSIGISSALGVIYPELIRLFSAPRSQAALVQSIYLGSMTGGGVLFTASMKRFGLGRTVMVGTVMSSIGLMVGSQTASIVVIITFTGLVAGIGGSVPYLGSYVGASMTFRDANARKIALAGISLSSTAAQAVFPLLADWLLKLVSLSGALMLLSGIVFQGLVFGLILHTSRRYFIVQSETKEDATDSKETKLWIKDPIVVQTILTFFFFSTMGPVEQWFLVDLTILRGYTRQDGSTLLTLLGAMGFVGRGSGMLLLRLFRKTSSAVHIVIGFLLFGIAHILVIEFEDFGQVAGAVVLRGISNGIIWSLMPSFEIELRGIHRYSETAVIINLANGAGQMTGGYMGGLVADLSGSYNLIFYLAAGNAVLVAGSITVLWVLGIRKQKPSEREKDNSVAPSNGYRKLPCKRDSKQGEGDSTV